MFFTFVKYGYKSFFDVLGVTFLDTHREIFLWKGIADVLAPLDKAESLFVAQIIVKARGIKVIVIGYAIDVEVIYRRAAPFV